MSLYLEANTKASIEAYYALNLQEFHMEPHRHTSCEIMYVAAGQCMVSDENSTITLKERQFVFLDAQTLHRLDVEAGTPCSLLNLEFLCRPSGSGYDYQAVRQHCPAFAQLASHSGAVVSRQDTGRLGHAIKDLIAELEGSAFTQEYMLHLLFQRMLIELARCSTKGKSAAGAAQLNRAVRYIEEHLYEALDVRCVAKHTGLNHSYLQTLFSKRFGCGIAAYINAQRMENAAFLLHNSGAKITDIAFHLGYNSRQHFGYLFQKHFSMSPQAFRKLKGEAAHANTGRAQRVADAHGCFTPHYLVPK